MNFLIPLALALALPQVRVPDRPAAHDFIVDEAKLISGDDAVEIKKIGEEILASKSAPIAVATIKSMRDYGAGNWTIERYARHVFDQWALGRADWNYGMLLLVSTGDRKVRIELGASWGHMKDGATQRLVNSRIVPQFKQQRFSAGVLEGVKGLRDIATEGIEVPQTGGAAPSHSVAPRPFIPVPIDRNPGYVRPHRTTGFPDSGMSGFGCLIAVFIGVVVLVVVMSIVRGIGGGSTSWGPGHGYGGGGFGSSFGGGFLGSMLGGWLSGGSSWHRGSHWNDSGGGWDSSGGSNWSGGDSGGSSWGGGDSGGGGGFSGGGGASGEW